ncbi:hypothetical protein A5906_26415 [Bradyrhizobium sacchari]|uniref:DUF6894 family protein n=1 Tax=Bradyrhizobium sacchari TaxID=1399419 RepID=UPI0009B19523|nr:hypothetical protein [Bradyrhizobium sacchari]OPY99259.1 hypothetical protein A5906_26415 [Bradyrhizobium sacchari]
MARYFFDVRNGWDFYPDEQGVELPSQADAEAEALDTLAKLARDFADKAPGQALRPDVAIEVRTASGPVFQAALLFAANRTTLQ